METVECYQWQSTQHIPLYREEESGSAIVRCRRCQAVYTRQKWTVEEISEKYTKDEDYPKACPASWSRDRLPIQFAELARIESSQPNRTSLLDVGGGGGAFVYAAQQLGWRAHGVDLSAAAISHARELWELTKVECVNFEEWMCETQCSMMTYFHVLEHVYHPAYFFAKVKQLLAPDGLFVIAVPNFGSIDMRRDMETFRLMSQLPFDVMHFTPRTLRRLLSAHGFRVVSGHLSPSQYVIDLARKFSCVNLIKFPLSKKSQRHLLSILWRWSRDQTSNQNFSTLLELSLPGHIWSRA